MNEFNFKNLEKRRPFWRDAVYFLGVTLIFWGTSQIVLNRDAFGQIAKFKYEQLKASVLEVSEEVSASEVLPEAKLQKVEKSNSKIHFRRKDLKSRNQAKQVFEDMRIYPSDNRIFIPTIGKNVPLISVPDHQNWNQLESNIQKGLRSGVVVHPVSHDPGVFGNFFVTGHSSYYPWDKGKFKDVFALLHEIKIGEKVEIFWEGKKYIYEIKQSEVVKPTEVGVLNQPKDKYLITLMTCTPVGTNTNRLILTGEMVASENSEDSDDSEVLE